MHSSRRRVARLALIVISAFFFTITSATGAHAHFSGRDSVDGFWFAYEIKYDDFTRYDDAKNWGISEWNKLGSVDIAPDDAVSIADLEYGDYYDSTTAVIGYYQERLTTDLINFNRYQMDKLTTFDKRMVGGHELGHALGLDHSYTTQLMSESCCWGINTPQSHDRSDYAALWS